MSAMGALAVSGCSAPECHGVRLARPTDGAIQASASTSFLTSQPVTRYEDDIADAVNEAWVKEYGQPIDSDICISYGAGVPGHVSYYDRTDKSIFMQSDGERFLNLLMICHALGHRTTGHEHLPEFVPYRIGTMMPLHFLTFSNDTRHLSFAIAHGTLLKDALGAFPDKEDHGIGALAAMLALNHHDGSFPAAENALGGSGYLRLADQFTSFCNQQPAVDGVVTVTRDGHYNPPTTRQYGFIATYDLWSIVAHQVITRNIKLNTGLDDQTRSLLSKAFKSAAQYSTVSLPGNPPTFYSSNATFYKEDLVRNPLVFLPQDYDYSIPKGL